MSQLTQTGRTSDDLLRLIEENHDNCSTCNVEFRDQEFTYQGYDASGAPCYVCTKCSSQLVEVAATYLYERRPYERPSADTKLWRYMDFTKFVSLLQSQSLYFNRADCFEDHYEGAKGNKSNKAIKQNGMLFILSSLETRCPIRPLVTHRLLHRHK